MPLPAENLRTNLATWAVPIDALPAVANVLHDFLPNEPFDSNFRGQHLETTYSTRPITRCARPGSRNRAISRCASVATNRPTATKPMRCPQRRRAKNSASKSSPRTRMTCSTAPPRSPPICHRTYAPA
jgi:hypothetical protein